MPGIIFNNRNFKTKPVFMKRLLFAIFLLSFVLPFTTRAQQVIFSDYERQDGRDMDFEVIGKMNGNILVYKNIGWRHRLNVFDASMKTIETINLDFVQEKTFNMDFVTYPDHFYMIYQYQKKNIVYCMAAKMDANGHKVGDPIQLDTTQIPVMADNKIYSTISSDDKQQIMVFKIHKKNERYNLVSLLFNSQLELQRKSREVIPFNDRRDNFGDFVLDNEGNLAFTIATQAGYRENNNALQLITKSPTSDTVSWHKIDLSERYIDEVKLKVDNLNKRYLINSLYYKKSRGSIEGLFNYSWDKVNAKPASSGFTQLYDTLRNEAKNEGLLRFAFDDFLIRQVVVKKDGGYILTAEDFSSQNRGNFGSPWNRWDYFNSPYTYNSGYYYYSPYGYYRPWNRFNNQQQSVRYYYANIIILGVDKNGQVQWSKVIPKDQFDDDEDRFMSFSLMNSGGELHFLFNENGKYQVMADHSINTDGKLTRNPTLKSQEKGYQFMPVMAKQTGARQIIIPCSYRGFICFAKVDF